MSVPVEMTDVRVVTTGLDLRDVDAVGTGPPYRYLEGRAVPYDTWADVGWYLEMHAPGSFEKTTTSGVAQRLPLLLFHNNRSWSVGHSEEWTNPADGLHGVWRLNDTDDAQKAARMARNGDLVGLSIGFQPIRSDPQMLDWEDWDPDLGWDHMDRIVRLESRLLEVSLTPTPAFEDARVTQVRAAGRRAEGDILGIETRDARPPRRQRDTAGELAAFRHFFDQGTARQAELDASVARRR